MAAESVVDPTKRNILLKQYLRDKLLQFDPSTAVFDLSDRPELWYGNESQARIVQNTTPRDYAGLDEMVETFCDPVKKPGLSIVDYGSGDGLKGIHVHQRLQAEGKLHQVDHSSDMLALAARNAEQASVPARSIMADLDISHDISRKIGDKSSRFHLFLGQTIGNPQQPEHFIESITSSMRKGEYLLVEWFKRTKEYYQGRKEFVMGYISDLGIPSEYFMRDDGELDYFVDEESDPSWFKCCLRVHKEFVHQETGKKIPAGSVIVATRSRRFTEDEAVSLFQQQGIEALVLHEWHEGKMSEGGDTPEPGVTRQQRWHEHGEYRYALFRKIKEGQPVLRWILSASLASVALAGAIYLNFFYNPEKITRNILRQDAPCIVDKIIESDLKVVCSTPKGIKKEFDIREIEQREFGLVAEEKGKTYALMSRNARHIEAILLYKELLHGLAEGHPLKFPADSYYPAFIEETKSCLGDDLKGTFVQSVILARKLERSGFPHPQELLEPIQELICSDEEQAGRFLERVLQDSFFHFLEKLSQEQYAPLLDGSRHDDRYDTFRDFIRMVMHIRDDSTWWQVYMAADRLVGSYSPDKGDEETVKAMYFTTAAIAFANIIDLLDLKLPEDQTSRALRISNSIDHMVVAGNLLGAVNLLGAELKRFEKPILHFDVESLKRGGIVRQEENKAYINLDAIVREQKFWDDYPIHKQETLDLVLDELEAYKARRTRKQLQVALISLGFWASNFSSKNDSPMNLSWMQALSVYVKALNQFDCLSEELGSRYNPKENKLSEYVASTAQRIYEGIRRGTDIEVTTDWFCAK